MKKLLLIAFTNIKKKKGAILVIGLLIFLATILLYVSMSTLGNVDKVAEKSYEYTNLADMEAILPKDSFEKCKPVIEKEEGVAEVLYVDVVECGSAKVETKDGDTTDTTLMITNIKSDTTISKMTADVNIKEFPDNGIVLSEYDRVTGAFQVGDTYRFTQSGKEYEFEVVGFSEDGMFATPINISVQKVYVSDKKYKEFTSDPDSDWYFIDVKMKVADGYNDSKVMNDLFGKIQAIDPEVDAHGGMSFAWSEMKGGVIMIPEIAMGIIFLFAIILIVIALTIIYYNVKNFMEENLTNVGIMKASGYTSSQLRFALLVEILVVSLVAILIGIGVGFGTTPLVGNLAAAMSGLPWRVGIDVVAALITAAIVLVAIVLLVTLLGRRYKKIFVLDALRGGSVARRKRKNIAIGIIVAFLTFASCAGIYMYDNFGKSSEPLLDFSGLDLGDVAAALPNGTKDMVDATTIEGVDYAFTGTDIDMNILSDGENIPLNVDVWSDCSVLKHDMLDAGHRPENADEIVLSNAIREQIDAELGDVVELTVGDFKANFTVVGFDSKINHFGRKGMITLDGLHRLNPDADVNTLYTVLKDGYTYEDVKDDFEKAYPDGFVFDSNAVVESAVGGLKTVMKALCILFLVVTLFIVFFILLMVVRSRIIEDKKNLGIKKALGYTTMQLVKENILHIIPVMVIGEAVGILGATFLMNSLVTLAFSSFGFGMLAFPANIFLYLILAGVVLLDAVVVTFLTSLKIKNIEPIKMLQE